ncbi:hypothetical protein MPTK1_8g02820 [Marchantia polymorpha subsp. ruderalis]|uniref:Uncharacterized protein n=1 Tax=Marchantia polymorpha TaxID=3197 RepID=A0A2R6XJ28_MARPO|nr:hypothetical protein MARPO_0012s0075 [Marchantia polymorpha]BBN18474.1 hypothetical protein Mp_8g02820 [Marchantia polymorpha subsp. ruderalis]|eukprot:PTQ46118.1 hypothetical protein MARPO_0012s0075 [Marchantia polymorpha]
MTTDFPSEGFYRFCGVIFLLPIAFIPWVGKEMGMLRIRILQMKMLLVLSRGRLQAAVEELDAIRLELNRLIRGTPATRMECAQ